MRSKPLHTIALLLFIFSCNYIKAQDAPPAYAHLKPIESLVGVWKARFDPPGDAPAGNLEIHFTWMGNKSYMQSSVYFHPDHAPVGLQLNPEFTIVGYDTGAAATKAWHFKYLQQGRTEAKIEANRLVIHQQQGKPGDANYRQQTKTYELEDMSTLVISETSGSGDTPESNPPALRLSKATDN